MAAKSGLPQTHCFVTTHDKAGKAIFYDKKEEVEMKPLGVANFSVIYTTDRFPANFDEDKDVKTFIGYRGVIPLAMKNGTVVRIVELSPGEASPMHRTTSLDYGVVLEGEIELILESFENGPTRLMKRGDVSVQRATSHAWRNPSETEWSKMLYVLVDADPVKIGGKALEDDHASIELPGQ